MNAIHLKGRLFIFLCLLPMSIGAILYAPFYNTLAISNILDIQDKSILLFTVSQYSAKIPTIIRHVLPDMLWAFSFSSFLGIIWGLEHETKLGVKSILLAGVAGSSYEFGQLFYLFPGHFDWIDLWASFVSGASAMIVILIVKRARHE